MLTSQPQRNSIRLNQITTGFLDQGQGDAVVALHGIPTSSLLFASLLPRLSGYRLIAPDLLGQGQTEVPPAGPLGYAAYADHVRAFMNTVPPQNFHLLIHDLGGVLGLEWATDNVERLKSLIILSTTVTPSLRVGRLLYAANLIGGQALLRWGMRLTLKRARHLDRALMDEWLKPWSRRRILRGTDHFAGQHLKRFRARLNRIHVPTLIIWGEQDDIFPPSHAADIKQALPQANMRMIKHCGHWSPLDAPDEVAQFMCEFFDSII